MPHLHAVKGFTGCSACNPLYFVIFTNITSIIKLSRYLMLVFIFLKKRVATAWYGKPVEISPAYEGRASLDVDPNTRVSTLHLTQLTMQENRHFQCSVLIYGDDDGTTRTTTSLVVLVPPSPPICKLQGSAEYFQNVTLTCLSEEASPAPTYDWKSFSVDNSPRQFPPKATQKDGVLSLFNITRETSGYYICTSQNRIGSASCNFTLAVMPASMKIGSTAAIIGGVLAGLLVVGILIFCLCRRRSKKNKYPEGYRGSPNNGLVHEKKEYREDHSFLWQEFRSLVTLPPVCAVKVYQRKK
uniref:Cell surface A33 antigen-like n=1 Tax=Haplochromis burtoni TaxID=8153 RepID=A0A3Q2V0X1_HAPBU